MTSQPGWLAEQLPRALAEDPFLSRFVRIFEDLGGGLRDRVDELDRYFDVALGPPDFVRWMASWVGQPIDSALPQDRQRSLAGAIGPLFPYRGTRRGLQAMLEALTRSEVEIDDSGGIYRSGQAPDRAPHVVITVGDAGELDEQQLLRIVRTEVPADTTVELIVGSASVETEEATDELERMVEESMDLAEDGTADERTEDTDDEA